MRGSARHPLPGLSAQARHAAERLESLADRWIDGPAPTAEELQDVVDELAGLLERIAVARTVVGPAADGTPADGPSALSA